MDGNFEVFVGKEDFKFNCAHFIAFRGFRERLHGHNYRLSIKITGDGSLSADGYLMDFGDIKQAARNLCKSMNEYFIVPVNSDVMTIEEDTTQVCLTCEDGAAFSFPKTDVLMLPIVHSSAEELAHYFWCQLCRKIGLSSLVERGIKLLEVSIAEAPNQMATYRNAIPLDDADLVTIEQTRIRHRVSRCLEDGDDDEK